MEVEDVAWLNRIQRRTVRRAGGEHGKCRYTGTREAQSNYLRSGFHCLWWRWSTCWNILDFLFQAKSLTLWSTEGRLECWRLWLLLGQFVLLLALMLTKKLGTATTFWVSTHVTNNCLIYLVLTSIAFTFFQRGCRMFLHFKPGRGQEIYFCKGEDGAFHAEGFISCIRMFFD